MLTKDFMLDGYKTTSIPKYQLYSAEIQLCKMGFSLFCDQNGLDLDELEDSLSSKLTLPFGANTVLAT